VFDLNWDDVRHLRGVSDQKKILRLLEANVAPAADGTPLTFASSRRPWWNTERYRERTGDNLRTGVQFDERDFTTAETLQQIFAQRQPPRPFPLRFRAIRSWRGNRPASTEHRQHTPIKYAVEGGGVDTVSSCRRPHSSWLRDLMADLRGVNLLGHIADMLINERLYRDLREAQT